MLKQISNFGKVLSRKEQKNVFGGYVEGPCSIYIPSMGWMSGYSVSDAQSLYQDPEVTGYCCASC